MSLDAEYLVSEIRGILAAHGLTPRRDKQEIKQLESRLSILKEMVKTR